MSDIIFDDTEQVTVLCGNLNVQGHDLLLDSPERRTPHGSAFRRALVHDLNDSLTINFGSDYPGGVTINGVRVLDVTGDIQFRISHQDEILLNGGQSPDETAHLGDVIKALRHEIAELKSQIATIAQRP